MIQDEHILYYIDDKWQDRESVRFYHENGRTVDLLKLIRPWTPACSTIWRNITTQSSSKIFGVGGLPSYESGDFYSSIEKWISMGKVVVMTTQVTREGSNMSVYEVGQRSKTPLGLIESYRFDTGGHRDKAHVDPRPDERS